MPQWVFTMRWNRCSRCRGIGVHDGPAHAAGRSFRQIAAELGVSVGKVHESLAGRRTVRQTPLKTASDDAPILGVS